MRTQAQAVSSTGTGPTVKTYRVLYTNQKAGKKSRRFQDGFVKITNDKQLELTNSEHQNVFKGNSFKKRLEEDSEQVIYNIGIYEIQVEEEITANEFKGTTPVEVGPTIHTFHQSSSSVPLLAEETPASFWDLGGKKAIPTSTTGLSGANQTSQGSKVPFQAPNKFKVPGTAPSTTSNSKLVEEVSESLPGSQLAKKPSPKKAVPAKPYTDPFKSLPSTAPNHLAEAMKQSSVKSPVKTPAYNHEIVEMPHDVSKVHLICSKGDFDGKIEHDVFIEPFLFKEMMPHQLEGVDFMFQCITGLKNDKMKGCILADMSGLGKTLQVIALMWTLFKQNPFVKEPFLKKVIIACPLLSVKSWKNEIAHWLGEKNLYPVVIEKVDPTASSQVKKFLKDSFRCLIVPYEVIQKEGKLFSEEVTADLLVCDEGHKLKSPNSQLYKVMKNINCVRRILMTSTPIQKDLTDLFASIRFVNPTLFKKENYFTDFFIVPITNGMAVGARPEERELAKSKTKSLLDIMALFMIRRTVSVVESLLPQKFEFQVIIKPTEYQVELYDKCLEAFRSDLGEPINEALIPYKTLNSVMSVLKKILFHPKEIIESGENSWEPVDVMKQDIYLKLFQKPLTLHSNKLVFIERLLDAIKASGEKLIIATHYPMTVNVLADFLTKKKINFHRVDSTGAAQKRQGLITGFNAPYSGVNVLILHIRVINTVPSMSAASRIVIVDMDRTSAGEQQLTSKVYTKGLTRPLHIYRLISGGTIEERMLEKQIQRDDIAALVLDEKEGPEYEFLPGDAKSFIGYYDERISPRNQRRKNYKDLMIDEVLGASQESSLLQSSGLGISAITPSFKEIIQFVGIEEERIRNPQELQIFTGQDELLSENKACDREDRVSESRFKDHEERLEKLIEGGRNPDDPPTLRNSRKLVQEEVEQRDSHGDEVLEAVFGKQAVIENKVDDNPVVDDTMERDLLWQELEAGLPKEPEQESKPVTTNMLLEALRSSGLGPDLGNDFFQDLGLEGSADRGQADQIPNQEIGGGEYETGECQNQFSSTETTSHNTLGNGQIEGLQEQVSGIVAEQETNTASGIGGVQTGDSGSQTNDWLGSSEAAALVFEKLKDFGIDLGDSGVNVESGVEEESGKVRLAEHEATGNQSESVGVESKEAVVEEHTAVSGVEPEQETHTSLVVQAPGGDTPHVQDDSRDPSMIVSEWQPTVSAVSGEETVECQTTGEVVTQDTVEGVCPQESVPTVEDPPVIPTPQTPEEVPLVPQEQGPN